MKIEQMKDMAAINRTITNVAKSVDTTKLQTLLVNVCFQAAVNANWNRKSFAVLWESNLSKDFKTSLAKHMPVGFDKNTNQFEFSAKKAASILKKLEFTADQEITFDMFAAAMPVFTKKPTSATAGDSLDKLQNNIASRLEKLGIENAQNIADIVKMLATSPSILANVSADLLDIAVPEEKAE